MEWIWNTYTFPVCQYVKHWIYCCVLSKSIWGANLSCSYSLMAIFFFQTKKGQVASLWNLVVAGPLMIRPWWITHTNMTGQGIEGRDQTILHIQKNPKHNHLNWTVTEARQHTFLATEVQVHSRGFSIFTHFFNYVSQNPGNTEAIYFHSKNPKNTTECKMSHNMTKYIL